MQNVLRKTVGRGGAFLRKLFGLPAPSPEWVKKGEISAKGGELRYWSEQGLEKGNAFYGGYLDLFKRKEEQFHGKVVSDFGYGPFGGVLSSLRKCANAPFQLYSLTENKRLFQPSHVIMCFAPTLSIML